jgi:hypothetical protein
MAKLRKRPKLPAVVRGIQAVEDLNENMVALLYGKAGRGKTKIASTFPGPILFLDINNEKGLKTVKKVPDVKFAKVNAWDDFLDLYWWLREGQSFGTIVLDQVTGLQDLCQKAVREHFNMKDSEQFQGFKKYGKLSGDMKTWLGNYKELNDLYNIVFIGHERAFGSGEEDDSEIDPSVSARVMPSVGSFLEGACDVIGQCYIGVKKFKDDTGKRVKKAEYRMRVGPHPTYTTKIRRPPDAGPLPEYIVDPSYRKLVAIESGEEVRNTAVKKEKRNGKGK